MWLRKSPVRRLIALQHRLDAEDIPVEIRQLEVLYLAGGDVERCVDAMIESHRRAAGWTWDDVMGVELAGGDPRAAVGAGAPPSAQPDRSSEIASDQ
jgi:uncharacterized protein YqfA (UPF0365 family)